MPSNRYSKKSVCTLLANHRCILIIFFLLWSGCHSSHTSSGRVCFGKNCFVVEVASTSRDRAQGLMFRSSLPENRGMLFVFPRESHQGFWMKNMKLPLDIIWLDSQKRVVSLTENAQPCLESDCPSFYPEKKIRYVLEISSGMAQKKGISVGKSAQFLNIKNIGKNSE